MSTGEEMSTHNYPHPCLRKDFYEQQDAQYFLQELDNKHTD